MGLKKVIRISYCSESVKEGGNDSYEWIPNLSGKKKNLMMMPSICTSWVVAITGGLVIV